MALAVEGQRQVPHVWTGEQLLDTDFPPPRWAVPGLIPEGLSILVGAPKVGKSWLALGLAVAVAAGGRALGRVSVERGESLYLALEDTARRLQDRLRKVLEGDPMPPGFHAAGEWPRVPDGGADALDAWLQIHPGCRLVLIDVLEKIRQPHTGNGSVYAADYAALEPLKAIAEKHRTAVVVLHHSRKASSDDWVDTVSGSFGLTGSADGTLLIKRARSKADAELHVTGRDVDEAQYALQQRGGVWSLLDGPASDYALGDTRRRILDHLRDHGPARPKVLADALDIAPDTVRQTVHRMVQDGQLDTDGQGLYMAPVPPSHLSLVSPSRRDSRDGSDSPTEGRP